MDAKLFTVEGHALFPPPYAHIFPYSPQQGLKIHTVELYVYFSIYLMCVLKIILYYTIVIISVKVISKQKKKFVLSSFPYAASYWLLNCIDTVEGTATLVV